LSRVKSNAIEATLDSELLVSLALSVLEIRHGLQVATGRLYGQSLVSTDEPTAAAASAVMTCPEMSSYTLITATDQSVERRLNESTCHIEQLPITLNDSHRHGSTLTTNWSKIKSRENNRGASVRNVTRDNDSAYERQPRDAAGGA